MATFIPFSSEDESLLELSRSFNKLRTKGKDQDESFVEECTKLISTPGHSLDLFNKLADEHPVLFAEASSQEIESFFLLALQPLSKPDASPQADHSSQNLSPSSLPQLTIRVCCV